MKRFKLHAVDISSESSIMAPTDDPKENVKRLTFLKSIGVEAKVGDPLAELFLRKTRSENLDFDDEEFETAILAVMRNNREVLRTMMWLAGVTLTQADVDAFAEFEAARQIADSSSDTKEDGNLAKCKVCEKRGNCFVEELMKSLLG